MVRLFISILICLLSLNVNAQNPYALTFKVQEDGIYWDYKTNIQNQLNWSDTAKKDLNLGLSKFGRSVPYYQNQDKLFFHCTPGVYWFKSGPNRHTEYVNRKPWGNTTSTVHATSVYLRKENHLNIQKGLTPDEIYDRYFWLYGKAISGLSSIDKFTETIYTPEVDPSKEGLISIAIAGTENIEYTVDIYLNDYKELTTTFPGGQIEQISFSIDQLQPTNKLVVQNKTGVYKMINVYDIAVAYHKSNNTRNILSALAQNTTVQVPQNSKILKIDNVYAQSHITGNFTYNNDMKQFRCFISGLYSIDELASNNAVTNYVKVYYNTLKSVNNATDHLIIYHKDLEQQAIRLKDYRQQEMNSMAVNYQDICDTFNYGINDKCAISNFIEYIQQQWIMPPKYVVILGRAGFKKDENEIPSNIFGLNETFLSDFNSNITIGRIPSQDPLIVDNIITKIINYENNSTRNCVVFTDQSDYAGDFYGTGISIATNLQQYNYTVVNYNKNELPAETVRTNVIHWMNNNSGLVIYNGHGTYQKFGESGLLKREDVLKLSSANSSVFLGMACKTGTFGIPNSDGLVESFLFASNGFVAAFASSVSISLNDSKVFYRNAFNDSLQQSPRLGDMHKNAITELIKSFRTSGYWGYQLFGDPAMKLP